MSYHTVVLIVAGSTELGGSLKTFQKPFRSEAPVKEVNLHGFNESKKAAIKWLVFPKGSC